MVIYDEKGNRVESPDYELGHVEENEVPVMHVWVIDMPEQSHEEIIREYPETGGKDIEIVVDVPEEGHWETHREDGSVIDDFDGDIAEGWPHDEPIPDIWRYGVYILYTPEELAKIEEQKLKADEAERKRREQQEWLEEAPDHMLDMDEAIVAL